MLHIALAGEEALTTEYDRDEGTRTGGLDIDAWSLQPQLVGDARGQKVDGVADEELKTPVGEKKTPRVDPPAQVVQQVGVERSRREDTDGHRLRLRVVSGVLERLPCALQEQPHLRVEELGFFRAVAEQGCVEQLDIVENSSGFYVRRIDDIRRRHTDGDQLLVRTKPVDFNTEGGNPTVLRMHDS